MLLQPQLAHVPIVSEAAAHSRVEGGGRQHLPANAEVRGDDLKERCKECKGSSLRRGGRADSRQILAPRTSDRKAAQSPCLHRASALGNLRTSCVQRKPVDTLSRWEALEQVRRDQGLRPLRHARLPWEAQPRVLILVKAVRASRSFPRPPPRPPVAAPAPALPAVRTCRIWFFLAVC
jgi:hypothetical protein